jgi:Zn-finger nucleic acid-binding protein
MEITLEKTQAPCPGCGDGLSVLPGAPGVVAGCFRCGGAWLDNRAAQWIVSTRPTPAMRAFVAALPASTGAPVDRDYRSAGYRGRCCPACEVELTAKRLRAPAVVVDVCESHGTYFDALELLQMFRATDVRGLQAEADRVASSAQQGGAGAAIAAEVALRLLMGDVV